MNKLLLRIALAVVLFCCVVTKVSADENFSTALQTTYTVNSDGSTRVEHAFALTNKTPTFFISKYGLKVSSGRIAHVSVLSNGKIIEPEVVSAADQTSIGVSFPDESVGEGKTRQFTISYTHPDLAQVTGKILEVTIPRLANATDYDSYQVAVKTPERFGQPTRVTPEDFKLSNSPGFIELRPSSNSGHGISAIYGTEQVFSLTIEYPLRNEHNQQAITQITLPPDTPFQRLHYTQLEPKPSTIEQDVDGNWIATYTLPPNSTKIVTANALAQLTLAPNTIVPMPKALHTYTDAKIFWQSNSSEIQQLAQQYQNASDIYTYTIETLDYTTQIIEENLERKGALGALQDPTNAACQEFTDLFIAIARAAGIPTRRAAGYAYTQNSQLRPLSFQRDILHAWPEYYDAQKQSWISIDPTWGDTTGGVDYFNQFDLNHIVFAYNGSSSTLPYPAGAYAQGDEPSKNITVSFTEQFESATPEVLLEVMPKTVGGLTIPGFYTLEVTNQSGQAWYGIDMRLESNVGKIKLEQSMPTVLLPFEVRKISFSVANDELLLSTAELSAQVTIQEETFTHAYHATAIPTIAYKIQEPQSLAALAAVGIIGTLIAGSIFIFRQRQPRTIRR